MRHCDFKQKNCIEIPNMTRITHRNDSCNSDSNSKFESLARMGCGYCMVVLSSPALNRSQVAYNLVKKSINEQSFAQQLSSGALWTKSGLSRWVYEGRSYRKTPTKGCELSCVCKNDCISAVAALRSAWLTTSSNGWGSSDGQSNENSTPFVCRMWILRHCSEVISPCHLHSLLTSTVVSLS